jgi:formyl-CoA transferase
MVFMHQMIIERPGPLGGVRVLDLSSYIAGPYAGSLLADLGAEVIKIEPPEGDNLRRYPSTLEAESRAFLGVNRSKRGVVLDLKQAAGISALLRLAQHADVLLHSFRPRVPARLGIDYERLREMNSRLIYCGLSGYGERGPMRDRAGYDQVLQAMTGICDAQGMGKDAPDIAYGSVVDFHAGSLMALGILAALYSREKTGRGQKVEVSLLASALAMQSARFVEVAGEPVEIDRDMRSGGVTGIHPTGDGHLYLSANTPHFWESLCRLTGLVDVAADSRYDTVRKRKQHEREIVPLLREALARRTALEWEEVFGESVPCAAIRPIGEMFNHPQVVAEELVTEVTHPLAGTYKMLREPLKFSATPGPEPFAAPALGQHTEMVLEELEKDRHGKNAH